MLKNKTAEFIEKAIKIHGDRYSYGNVNYINSHTPVSITCKTHGDFMQSPTNHLQGKGCPKCANKNVTTEEFIEKARLTHGDKYDYSKVNYTKNSTKVCIICPEHGEFWQTPNDHLSGKGCQLCSGNRKMTTDDFVRKAKLVHGESDDFSEVDYANAYTKITLICHKHGRYSITPTNYLSGQRCRECAKEKTGAKKQMSMNDFILKARQIHGYKDTFEKTDLSNRDGHGKICVTCKEHGDYWITPNSYLRGSRCPVCGKIKAASARRKPIEAFQQEILQKYGDNINVDNSVYRNNKTNLIATCKIHGDFNVRPFDLLRNKYGCPKCSGSAKLTFEELVSRFREVHGDKYVYVEPEDGEYGVDHKMKIICPIHGEFEQTPYRHMNGNGCPKCCSSTSKDENKIIDYIKGLLGEDCIKTKDHTVLDGKEIDILIPSLKIGIEYDGLYWHSEANGKDRDYHLEKTELAESKGYRLIHIFEDEWCEHEDVVKNKIKHLLKCDKSKVVGARKCRIATIDNSMAGTFLNTFHIQGHVNSTLYYGAYYNDELVGVMSLLKERDGIWNLTRFATNFKYRLPGLANKLFKAFVDYNNPIEVKTFLDRRWGTLNGNVYDKMGFKLAEIEKPDYSYIRGQKRYHKFGFRKQTLHKKYGLPLSMTEKEMAQRLGYPRIWNCGLYKYVWKNNKQQN